MSHGCSKSGGHCLSNVLNLLQASPRLSSGLCLNFWTCFFTFMVLVSGKNSFINNLWSWGQERKWWLSWLSGYLNASPITENENYFNRMTWYAPKRALERVGLGLNCDVFMPVYGQFMKEKLWCVHSCKTLPFVVFQSNSRRTKQGPRGQRRKQRRSEVAEGGSTQLPRVEPFQYGSTRGAHVEGIIMGEIVKSALWRLFEANPNTFWAILILKLSFLLPPLGGFLFLLVFKF